MAESTVAKRLTEDQLDERLIQSEGVAGIVRLALNRLRGGELGSLPVVVGLAVIAVVFYSLEPAFLSSRNLVSITQFAAPVGMIALGVVMVLMLGEIDLSVGSISGLAAAVMAVLVVRHDQSMLVGIIAALAVAVIIGVAYALLHQKAGVPSFVFSLAGLLGFQGLMLYVLNTKGGVDLPRDDVLVRYARYEFLPHAASYVVVVLIGLAYLGSQLWSIRRRASADLSTPWLPLVLTKAGALTVGLLLLTSYLNVDRGWSYLWLFFVVLVLVVDFAFRHTAWGRYMFAVGGNEEAARRAGIKVGLIYTTSFVLGTVLAATGGIMTAAQTISVTQSSGANETNLMAIAAAVIGGTSLFGGRGSAYAAMLGALVLMSINSGLNMMNVGADVRAMVTGLVLLLAVAIDSVSRRARTAQGRG